MALNKNTSMGKTNMAAMQNEAPVSAKDEQLNDMAAVNGEHLPNEGEESTEEPGED
jgi:hypothetical protein